MESKTDRVRARVRWYDVCMSTVYGLEKLKLLLNNEEFISALQWERKLDDYNYAFRARILGERFGLKSWLHPILECLIETGEFKPELANDPVGIEVDRTKSRGLKLVLAEDISQVELKIHNRELEK